MTVDLVLDKFNSLHPRSFEYLEGLEAWLSPCSDGSVVLAVTLVMGGVSSSKLRLDFQGVRDLKIGHIEHRLSWLLEIRSIRGDQQEGLRYKVVESEEGFISFYCSNFEVKLIGSV